MNVIRPEVSLNDSALFLLRQLMQYLPEVTPQLSEDTFSSVLRDEHNVILAVPFGVG